MPSANRKRRKVGLSAAPKQSIHIMITRQSKGVLKARPGGRASTSSAGKSRQNSRSSINRGVELHCVKEGSKNGRIKVIRADMPSEKGFKNKEYNDRYGGWNKVGVVWEHVNTPSNKLKSLETVKIWASNYKVSNERHSQCGIWGVIGNSAYELGLDNVGPFPEYFTFYEDGINTKGKEFELQTFDSVFLGVRSAPYPKWMAACHGFVLQYTCF